MMYVTVSCDCHVVQCSVFMLASCDDEMKDLLLLRRIRMLHWLEPHHLDIPLNLHNKQVQQMVSSGRDGKQLMI